MFTNWSRGALVLSILCLVMLQWPYPTISQYQCTPDSKTHIVSNNVYNISNPILIQGDSDFAVKAIAYEWSGNGSQSNPYIIARLNITDYTFTSPLISIINTSVFFEFRDCLIVGGTEGIHLERVMNAIILNNSIYHSMSQGIYLFHSSNCFLIDNYISSNEHYGILTDYSPFCSFSNNSIVDNTDSGIKLRDSSDAFLQNNTARKNREHGIVLANSMRCSVIDNIVSDNKLIGISVEQSTPIELSNNTIFKNGYEGVTITGSLVPCDVTGNTFYLNGMCGLRLQSPLVSVQRNNFIDNGAMFPGIVQVIDNSENTSYSHNYWNDWLVPDSNNDNIVDIPYMAQSEFNVTDEYPQVYAYISKVLHVLTRPTLLFPNDTLNHGFYYGIMEILWTPSSDTFGHHVIYNIDFTQEGNNDWQPIESGINTTSYPWNTTKEGQNQNYQVRVTAVCSESLIAQYTSNVTFIVCKHTLSAPTFIFPIGSEIVSSSLEIQWTPSIDTWEHQVFYSVYYSSDHGQTWKFLEDDLTNTTCTWWLRSLPDGGYLLKVTSYETSGLMNESVLVSEITLINILDNLPGIIGGTTIVLIIVVLVVFKMKKRTN